MKNLIPFILLFSSVCFALPEDQIEKSWHSKALPLFQSMTKGELKNAQNMTLSYSYLKNDQNDKTLVIVPGRTEPAMKYAEVIYDLKDHGFNIFIMDHQGQGASERILKKETTKGHVIKFNDYVVDFEQFMNEVVTPNSTGPKYLLSHSMGGAISVLYLNKNPNVFAKAILVAPMLLPDTRPYPETVALYLSKILVAARQGEKYAPGQGPYIPDQDTFDVSRYTLSEARFNINKFIYVNWPALALEGPSSRWVHESMVATKGIDRLPVKTPILMLQAGLDNVVKASRQNSFCKLHECEMKHFPDSKHEILMERDSIRDGAMEEIKLFLGL